MRYKYQCEDCQTIFFIFCACSERNNQQCPKCKSHNISKFIGNLIPCGTRDNFGIKNEFYDHNTGQVIDNWKSWDKAGFKTYDANRDRNVRQKAKEKIKRIKKGETR